MADQHQVIMSHILHDLKVSPETNRWTPYTWSIAYTIISIALRHCIKSTNKALYCVPSQKYLAKRAQCHRVTVARITATLQKAGWIIKTNRRKEEGRFKTNLYYFGALLWKRIKSVTSRFHSIFHRVTRMLHIGTIYGKVTSLKREKDTKMKGIEEIIERCRIRSREICNKNTTI